MHPDFVVCKPKNNYYHSLMHRDFGIKLSLDFRKAVETGEVVGYGHLELNISPHYHFNGYLHNGNDLTPKNSVKSISDILAYLGIEPNEYDLLKRSFMGRAGRDYAASRGEYLNGIILAKYIFKFNNADTGPVTYPE